MSNILVSDVLVPLAICLFCAIGVGVYFVLIMLAIGSTARREQEHYRRRQAEYDAMFEVGDE